MVLEFCDLLAKELRVGEGMLYVYCIVAGVSIMLKTASASDGCNLRRINLSVIMGS